MNSLTWADFDKVDIRVGTIIEVEDFPEAKNPAYKIHIDFGPELGIKKTSAQVTSLYNKEVLLHKQVLAVVNFPPKQIATFMSECLLLGAVDGAAVTLVHPGLKVANGLRVS